MMYPMLNTFCTFGCQLFILFYKHGTITEEKQFLLGSTDIC